MGVVPGSVEEPNVKIFRGAASLCVLGERREAEIDFALDAVRGSGGKRSEELEIGATCANSTQLFCQVCENEL